MNIPPEIYSMYKLDLKSVNLSCIFLTFTKEIYIYFYPIPTSPRIILLADIAHFLRGITKWSKFINNANKHLKASNSTEITVINMVG